MSGTQSGNAANYPLSFTVPSDGDGPDIKAADVNVGFEALADRTAWLKSKVAPSILVGRKKIISSAGLSIVKGTTATATVDISSGFTTEVGDDIEILLVGNAAFQYATYGANSNGLIVQLSTQEAGGGFAVLNSQEFTLSDRNLTTGFGSFEKGSVSILSFKTVAAAGAFDLRIVIAFAGTGNTGDAGDLIAYRAILNQFRSS